MSGPFVRTVRPWCHESRGADRNHHRPSCSRRAPAALAAAPPPALRAPTPQLRAARWPPHRPPRPPDPPPTPSRVAVSRTTTRPCRYPPTPPQAPAPDPDRIGSGSGSGSDAASPSAVADELTPSATAEESTPSSTADEPTPPATTATTLPAAAVSTAGCGATSPVPIGQPTQRTVRVGGQERDYLIYLPTGYSPDQPAPSVTTFHGLGGNAWLQLVTTGVVESANATAMS